VRWGFGGERVSGGELCFLFASCDPPIMSFSPPLSVSSRDLTGRGEIQINLSRSIADSFLPNNYRPFLSIFSIRPLSASIFFSKPELAELLKIWVLTKKLIPVSRPIAT
jgi:hypothetical protein